MGYYPTTLRLIAQFLVKLETSYTYSFFLHHLPIKCGCLFFCPNKISCSSQKPYTLIHTNVFFPKGYCSKIQNYWGLATQTQKFYSGATKTKWTQFCGCKFQPPLFQILGRGNKRPDQPKLDSKAAQSPAVVTGLTTLSPCPHTPGALWPTYNYWHLPLHTLVWACVFTICLPFQCLRLCILSNANVYILYRASLNIRSSPKLSIPKLSGQ
jgi:hypothetical protein